MPSPADIAVAFARHRAAGFVGRATGLDDLDLPAAGYVIGVGEDEIHAVMDVETAGGAFDKHGRPKMLFEPHVFYRHLSGADRAHAVQSGIAYAAWKPGGYPSDSYPRLAAAMAIDETAALKAASWGLGQILGENFVAAGYDSPQHMVVSFVDAGAVEHLMAMVRFIKANHLDDELRAHNWAGFARGYNGPKYAVHGYHTKLAAAYAKWSRIQDTPWSPEMDATRGLVPIGPVEVTPLPPVPAGKVLAPVPQIPAGPLTKPAPRRTVTPPVTAGPTVRTGGFWADLKSLFKKKAS